MLMRINRLVGLSLAALVSLLLGMPLANAESRAEQHHKQQRSTEKPVSDRATRVPAARRIKHPPVGRTVQRLPSKHQSIRVKQKTYRYHNGAFYRPGRDNLFVVVRAPLGARVQRIPQGYISFYIGPRHYFYSNYTYYLWDTPTREYIVVEEPVGAENAVVTASETAYGELYVYPNQGQTDEQRDRDRYDCYLWASKETGFDPGDHAADVGETAIDYRRALSACLEGRGYTVK